MLSDTQRERIEVVLVSPRNPLNIGAVARAMANFGFARLAVVAAYEPHWREAKSAVGAPQVLNNARDVATLADAIGDATLVLGTGTLTYRRPEQRVVSLPDIVPILRDELAGGGRITLVFGPEKHGLTREDLSFCHLLLEIPTNPLQPSMNLGQAAAVCLYEIAARISPNENDNASKLPSAKNADQSAEHLSTTSASSGQLNLLAGLIDEIMLAAQYSPPKMQAANRQSVRLLLRRLRVNSADNRRILGLFRRILWRLRRDSPASNVTNE